LLEVAKHEVALIRLAVLLIIRSSLDLLHLTRKWIFDLYLDRRRGLVTLIIYQTATFLNWFLTASSSALVQLLGPFLRDK
jgi:hypothetical protein